MPQNGVKPLPPVEAGKPVSAARQNAFEASVLTDISVGPGLLQSRVGNAVAITLADDGRPMEKSVIVQITGEASGGGQYVGKIMADFSTADGIGPLVMPEGLRSPDTEDALILHPAESLTHSLATDGSVYVLGKVVGRVTTAGAYANKFIVIIERIEGGTAGTIFKMVLTGDSDIATPAIYPAKKVDTFNAPYGPEVQVVCPVAHGTSGGGDPDYIYGYQPVGGTGETVSGSAVTWAEVGRSGQWFIVDLTHSSGTGTPASPHTYYCAVKGNNLTATAVAPSYRPVSAAVLSQATYGWGRIKPTDYSFELVIAEETHVPVIPVDLTVESAAPGALPTYTAKVGSVTAGTGLSPFRPFGSSLNVLEPADNGMGYFSGSAFELTWTNETYDFEAACDS